MNISEIRVCAYWQPIGPIEWEDRFRLEVPEELREEIDQHIPHQTVVRHSLLGIHAVRCSGCKTTLWQEPAREGITLFP